MITLNSCLVSQIISFILPPNEYGCVYAWITLGSGPAIDLRKMPILEIKIIFSDETHFDLGGYVNKQNCCIWATENPHAYIAFFSKMNKERTFVIGPCWTNFSSQKLKRRILVTFGFNRTALRATHRCFTPCFWRSHYQPQSWCRLATSELRFDTIGLLFVACRQR